MKNTNECTKTPSARKQTKHTQNNNADTRVTVSYRWYLLVSDLGERGGELDELLDRRRNAAHLVVGALDDDEQRRALLGGWRAEGPKGPGRSEEKHTIKRSKISD